MAININLIENFKNSNFKNIIWRFGLVVSFTFIQFGCKDLITVESPNNNLNSINVFSRDETAISVVTNIYAKLSNDNQSFAGAGHLTNSSIYAGLSADELTLYNTGNTLLYLFYTNSLTADYDISVWNYNYNILFLINSAIEGLTNNKSLSASVQRQLLGEAKFMRAFCYFYLVNFYGDLPLVLSTDPLINAVMPRTSKDKIYNQIIDDLKISQDLLSENFLAGNLTGTTSERVRPTKWSATALLSRVYLYLSNYKDSEIESSKILETQGIFNLDSLNEVFLKNSSECIWQLQCVTNQSANTGDGKTFILPSTGPDANNYPVYLSHYIINSFEPGDLRKTSWTDSVLVNNETYYYPFKYKSGATSTGTTEYLMVFRLAEQYLIRSESRAHLDKLTDALSDLNIIRKRAGLSIYYSNSKDSIINAIMNERKVELFTEWGHRWLDLKRTNLVNNVMGQVTTEKGGVWSPNWQLYPIGIYDLQADPNLVQNEGY